MGFGQNLKGVHYKQVFQHGGGLCNTPSLVPCVHLWFETVLNETSEKLSNMTCDELLFTYLANYRII